MIGVILVVLVTIAVVLGMLAFVVRSLLFVSEPNEALIFSGTRRQIGPGQELGYRIVRGGRSMRTPLLEAVNRIDLTMFTIDVVVQNAYSKGGIPLNVVGVANVKVAGDEPLLDNAIERFLGKSRPEVMRIAKETLEGNLRGVLAQMTPEQVNEDKTRFAQNLIEEAEHDMHRMGLVLETLKVQNVSDDVGYLNSIGRIRGAVVRREAAIAEADCKAAEERARGDASRIVEQGKAQAGALRMLVEQYRKAGPAAREVLALQKILPLVWSVSGAQQKLTIRKVTVLPTHHDGEADWTKGAIGTAEQLRAATGIDLGAIAKRLAGPQPPKPPGGT